MKKTYSGNEKRLSSRYKVTFPLELSGDDFRFKTEMRDISCQGIFCRSDRFIPLKTKLRVTMAFDLYINKRKVERKLSCIAEVARISPAAKEGQRNYDVGIAFTEITQDERAVIIRFVRQKNIKEAKELRKMYYALKDMVCRLTVLEESHPTAEHFRKVINHAIEELDSVAYILDSEIDELRSLGQEADG